MRQIHPIPPLFSAESEVLILGSFPSVKSREQVFFYGHPQNRFWRVLAGVFACETPETVAEKTDFILSRHLALWDVIAECEIAGSADASIKNVRPNDLGVILNRAPIRQIYVNGRTAETYYRRYLEKIWKRRAVCLPSTSPANAAWSLERLIAAWSQITEGSSEYPIPKV